MSTPFPELESYLPGARTPRQPSTSQAAETWLDREMERQRDQQIRETLTSAPSPDAVARTERLARETGSNVGDVEGSEDAAERSLRARKMADIAGQHPAVGKWASTNPRGAAMAADDTQNLGRIAGAWSWLKAHDPVMGFARLVDEFDRTDPGSASSSVIAPVYAGVAALMGDQEARKRLPAIASRTGGALKAGGLRMVSGGLGYARGVAENGGAAAMLSPLGSLLSKDFRTSINGTVAETTERWAHSIDAAADRALPQTGDWATDQVLGGISNVPNTAASLATSLAARGAGLSVRLATMLGTSIGGVTQGGASYNAARDQGVDATTAFLYANTDAATEIAGEYLGTSKFLRLTDAGASVVTRYLKTQVPELIGEEGTTIAQSLSAWLVLPSNREKTLGDWASGLPGELAATAVQTLVAGGISHVTVSGLEKGLNLYGERIREHAGSRVGDKVRAAASAREERRVLDRLIAAAAESKLKKRDPEAFRTLQRHLAEESGAQYAFVPGLTMTGFAAGSQFE